MNPGQECPICPDGSISITGSSKCSICSSGKWAGGALSTDHILCTKCGQGKYNQYLGSGSIDSCLDCPKGKYSSIEGLSSLNNCIPPEPNIGRIAM